MGAVEEGGKVATGIVDSLKTQPATLAMIVISFGLLAYTFYEGRAFNMQRQLLFKDLMDQQKHNADLLSRCVVPKTSFTLEPLKPLVDIHDDH